MKKWIRIFWTAIQAWLEDRANTLAAALAFYTAISLAPLLVLVTAIAGFFVGEDLAVGEIATQVETAIGPRASEIVETAVRNASELGGGGISTLISVIGILIGATVVFAQLQVALTVIWNIPQEEQITGIRGILIKRLVSFGMILVTGFLLLVSLVINAALAAVNHQVVSFLPQSDFVMRLINFTLSLLITTAIFSLIFQYLPDREVPWRSAWFGGIVTALLFMVGQNLLGIYLRRAAPTSAYGAAGSLALILLWVYYSTMILLYGGELSQAYTEEMTA